MVERISRAHAASSRAAPVSAPVAAGRQVKMRSRLGVPFDRPGAARLVGPGDRHALDVGLVARVAAGALAGERAQVELADTLRLRRGLAQEGDADRVRAGGDRRAHLERLDLRHVEPARVVGIGPLADRQQRDPLAVDGDLEVVRLDAQRPVRQDLEDVLRVLGEVVVDHHPAAGAERQPLHAAVLPQVGGDPERLGRRRRHRRRHREAADLARRRQVALHQRRRDAEDAGDVVEAVARVVGRQQLADVDVERQQVAHGVAVLRPAQAVEGLRAAGVGIRRGGGVQLPFEPGPELRVGRGLRPGRGRGGMAPARSLRTTFSHTSACAATSVTSTAPEASVRPPVRSRSLWHVTQ